MEAGEFADQLVQKAVIAARAFEKLNQEQTDAIVEAVCEAGFNARVKLAKMAVEETKCGVWQHKVIKNVVATQLVYETIRHQKTVGMISEDFTSGITRFAKPCGPILAITPVTNPTSTVLFNILISLKSRNPIIISPHPRARKCCGEAMRICYERALKAGAPKDCIQILDEPSIDKTQAVMTHPALGLILATGGPAMVKSSYSSGNPAIGVGPGNVPCLIEKSADIPFAVKNILLSKTFDNGTICASEQSVIVEKEISEEIIAEFKRQGCYFLQSNEIAKLEKVAIDHDVKRMSPQIVGQSAGEILRMAGISAPPDTKVLLAPVKKIGIEEPLSCEILAPILTFYVKESFQEAIQACLEVSRYGGLGHTASLFSNDETKIQAFSASMEAGRILINTPSSQGAVGGIYNTVLTSLTLGCGTGGKNITSENITATHLINVNLCCRRRNNEKFCSFPQENYWDEKKNWKEILALYNKNF